MNVAELIALAKTKKIDKKSAEAFKVRHTNREKEFKSRSRRQEVSEQFLARSYNL